MLKVTEKKIVKGKIKVSEAKDNIYKNRWLILVNVVLATFMATLDGSIVNVALPDMSTSLHVSTSAVEWVVTSFLITVAATILIFGRLGDIVGKTRVFRVGVVIFTIGSLFCGFTGSLWILVGARVLQAIGAAATMANNQGIITQVFPARERGRALGLIGTFVALGAMTGPPLGGLIVSAFSWKYIFLINVPIGIVVFFMTLKIFPKVAEVKDEPLDMKGAILFIITMVAFFGAIEQGQNAGFNSPLIIGALIISVIAFILFLIVEKKLELPLLQLNIFSNSLFSISIICGLISFIAISASNIILPFYFEDAKQISPAITGFYMMVSPIVLAIVAPFSGYLSDRIGSEILTLIGLIFSSIGYGLIATLNVGSPVMLLMVFIVIMTFGNGMFQSPNNSLVMSTVPKDKLGIAGSVNALIRNVGMVLGTSLATVLLYDKMSSKIGHKVVDYVSGRPDVFMYGMRYVYMCAAVMCVIGAVITAVRYYNSKR